MATLVRRVERLISLVVLYRVAKHIFKRGPRAVFKTLIGYFLSAARRSLPGVDKLVQNELAKEAAKIEHKFHGAGDPDAVLALPKCGNLVSKIKSLAEKRKRADEEKARQKFGKSWGGIYHDHEKSARSKELCDLQLAIYKEFSQTNALYPAVFSAVRKFEAEVISATLSVLGGKRQRHTFDCEHADGFNVLSPVQTHIEKDGSGKPAPDADPCGLLTSGGTESILIAILSFREAAKERGLESPEIIASHTAHPALDKACHYFGVALTKLKPDAKTQKLTAEIVRGNVTKRTIAIYASAPTFAHGVVDAIAELSDLAVSKSVYLHVDNCLGGFYLSFLKPFIENHQWNFDLPGVSTISVDVHKYGFASKGVSVIAFRSPELRRKAYFPVIDGPTLYVTPTLQGARGGAHIASAWATLMFMGEDGYEKSAQELDMTFRKFKDAVTENDYLQLLVDSDLSIIPVIARPGSGLNIYAVANELEKRGWGIFTARDPACFSLCIGEQHTNLVSVWAADLQASVDSVKANPGMEIVGDAAVYGAAENLPDEILDSVVRSYVDTTLAVRPKEAVEG